MEGGAQKLAHTSPTMRPNRANTAPVKDHNPWVSQEFMIDTVNAVLRIDVFDPRFPQYFRSIIRPLHVLRVGVMVAVRRKLILFAS